jgi:hypothetical protein
MLPVLLVLTSTFSLEASMSLGKRNVSQRRETVFDMCFLGLFWALVVLLITLAFGATWHVSLASLPTLVVRILLEALLVYNLAETTVMADRTTMAFLRLLTIPLLLVVDISLGYHITNVQLAGIGVMFCALVLAFRHNARSRRGAWRAVLSAIIAVGTVSLYKYDITNYNSVVGEQSVVLSALIIFFLFMARRQKRSPLALLLKPNTGTQSLANGISIALESFALSLAPASIIITLKRSFAVVWAIVFGGVYFHEHSLKRKVSSGALLALSLILIASPQIHL